MASLKVRGSIPLCRVPLGNLMSIALDITESPVTGVQGLGVEDDFTLS